MSHFDPYHKWLGISPKDQPPNHYRLLGVELLESDFDVIENAANQRMAHVRSFQMGQHAGESQRLLNELATAKLILLDPERKAIYDQQLAALVDAPPTEYVMQAEPEPEMESPTAFMGTAAGGAKSRRGRQKNMPLELVKIVLGGLAGIAIAFVLPGLLRGDWDTLGIAKTVRSKLAGKPAPRERLDSPLDDPAPEPVPEVKPPPVTPPGPQPKPPQPKPPQPQPPMQNDPATLKPVQPKPLDIVAVRGLPAARGTPSQKYTRCDSGQPAKTLSPCADSFVVASLLGGHFNGPEESFDIDVIDVQGVAHWRLRASGKHAIASAATEIETPLRAWFEDQVEFKEWKRGDQPVQLIHRNDGFAVLSGFTGRLQGQEIAQVTLDGDGYWYLSGKAAHEMRIRAVIYRFKLPGLLRAGVEDHPLKPGDHQTKLHFDEAICSISHVAGSFKGFGEAIHCEVNERGWWAFKCNAQQRTTSGTVTSIIIDVRSIVELAQNAPMEKLTAPSAEEQANLQKQLASNLKGQSAAELTELAKDQSGDERYVVLIAARDAAAADGDCASAIAQVKAIDGEFVVDVFDLTTETLQKLRAGCETAAANRELATRALAHFDLGVTLKKNDALRPLAELALAAGLAAQDNDLQRRATLKLLELAK